MIVLITLALALSTYLGWHDIAGGQVIGCGGGSPCEKVLSSRWSTIAGLVPVSSLAMGVYLAMLIASLYIGPRTPLPVRQVAWCAILVLVGAAAGSAIWFTIVQRWIIGAFCPYCMTTHAIGMLLAALLIWRTTMGSRDDSGRWLAIGRLPAIGLVFSGLALAGILAVCQVAFKPRTIYRGGQRPGDLTALDPRTVPLMGSPEARYIVDVLFDYKCPHCQRLHFMLDEAVRRYNGKLAFVLCPSPLNSQCNRYVARDLEQYKDSCELARVGLAVWIAQPEAFSTFNAWMFSWDSGDRWHPRGLEVAKAKAVELVGQARFDAAWSDPWVDKYLQACIRIYGTTIQGGNGGIPKLVFGTSWVIPEAEDADDLIGILQVGLGLPEP